MPVGDLMFFLTRSKARRAGRECQILHDYGSTGGFPVRTLRITAYPMMPVASENELEETLAVDPLFIDYTMSADISGPTFDIVVPADAEGFNTSAAGGETSGGNEP